MTEPDRTTHDEVDDSSEHILGTETNSMQSQVKMLGIVWFCIILAVFLFISV